MPVSYPEPAVVYARRGYNKIGNFMNQKHTFELAIIGGGPAGVTAALRAKELGAGRVVLFERGDWGGTCTNDGCVPMRVLAKAARLLRDSRQWDTFGLTGTAPGVDMPTLMARVRGVVDAMHDKKTIRERLETAGVEIVQGRGAARFMDAHTLCVADGEAFTASKIILCAGGHSVRPPFPGAELAHSHSDLWNLQSVPKRAVIVGAAATGCQAASVLKAFGAQEVTLIDVAPRLLPGEDTFVSRVVQDGFAANGIRVLVGTKGVTGITIGDAGVRHVQIDLGGGATEVITADLALLSVGWKANLAPLCLDAANVQTDRGYVTVDDTLRSVSAPHIFAAGDINGRLMLVQTATEQATIAAHNALRGTRHTDKRHIVPHGGFTDPEYASVGMTEDAARESEPDCVVATASLTHTDRAVIDGRTSGGCKLIVSRQTHRLLGAHVAGEEAMEVIHLCAGAMTGGVTVDRLARMELAYPTYSAIVGRAARDICREMGLIPCTADGLEGCVAEWEHGGG